MNKKAALTEMEKVVAERSRELQLWPRRQPNRAKLRRLEAEERRLAIAACGMAAEIGGDSAGRYAATTSEVVAWAREKFAVEGK